MTSIYKKVVIKQIVKELDLIICLYDYYQQSTSNEERHGWGNGIFESIENLKPYQEIWQLHEQYLELEEKDL